MEDSDTTEEEEESQRARKGGPLYSSKLDDGMDPDDSEDRANEGELAKSKNKGVCLSY